MKASKTGNTELSSDQEVDFDKGLKRIQYETAIVDLETKRQALKGNTFWARTFTNPIVLGALITAFIAFNTASLNFLQSSHQASVEMNKLESDFRLQEMRLISDIVLKAIQTGDPDKAAVNLKSMVDLHLITNLEVSDAIEKYLSARAPAAGPTFPSPPGN
jgi:hypothetical protein